MIVLQNLISITLMIILHYWVRFDATVQKISRPGKNQRAFYSGKHKFHCVKTQVFVSPVGLLMHYSKTVDGKIHDFALFKNSKLIELIKNENSNCNKFF